MLSITAIILTKNEEKNLRKCLNSMKNLPTRIVVVDSYSDDKTEQIAKEYGCDFYQNHFVDHATQVNWGIQNCNIDTEWVMRIDADEEFTPELVLELESTLRDLSNEITGVVLRRRVYFMGKWIKHGGFYPHLLLRIWRREKAFCEQTIMDEHMVLIEGEAISLSSDFIDNNDKDLEWWINKHNWYSKREAIDYMIKKRKVELDDVKPNLLGNATERKRWFKQKVYYRTPLMRRAHWYFLYRYILRMGFLDGKEGLIFHFLQAYWYRFLVDAKLFEAEKKGIELELDGAL